MYTHYRIRPFFVQSQPSRHNTIRPILQQFLLFQRLWVHFIVAPWLFGSIRRLSFRRDPGFGNKITDINGALKKIWLNDILGRRLRFHSSSVKLLRYFIVSQFNLLNNKRKVFRPPCFCYDDSGERLLIISNQLRTAG